MTEVGVDTRCSSLSTMAFASVLLFIFSFHSCYAQVPLLMWTSDGYSLPHLTQPPAGHVVSDGHLVSYLKSALNTAPHNVVLFLQDKLSIDDFTIYGGVFGNKQDSALYNIEVSLDLAALQASSNPLVLPSLVWSASDSVLELFQQELGIPAVHINPGTLKEFQLNASQPSLLAVHLPYTTGVEAKEMLLKNDKIIGEVLGMFKSHGVPYTAIYTGLKPSTIIQDPVMAGSSIGRSLLQAPPQGSVKRPVIFNNTQGQPCILLWAENLNVSYMGKWVDLGTAAFSGSATLTGSTCNQTVSRLVLNYQNVFNFSTLRLIFSMRNSLFPVSARNWSVLEQVVIEYNGLRAIFNGSGGIYSPAEYSFHCQSMSSTQSPLLVPTESAAQWSLSFADFQIQGFSVTGGNFSYASDCAGFFTPGIWMGLLTSLLMVLILTYGLHMIMQLRTMDRFDDPKGPAISVPLNE